MQRAIHLSASFHSWHATAKHHLTFSVAMSFLPDHHKRLSFLRLASAYRYLFNIYLFAFSALTLLVGQQEGHPACRKTEWWGAGVVVCLEQGADLHMAQLMLLPLIVSCFSKIQIGFTFLVPTHPGSPGKGR